VAVEVTFRGEKIQVPWTLADRFVNWKNPTAGMERFKARTTMALANGGYKSASKSRRQTSQWSTNGNDADAVIQRDLPALRERSRDAVRNFPLATGVINTNCTNVIGTGLRMKSQINRNILNLSEDEANEWETHTESEFKLWAESKECDAARTSDFFEQQEVSYRSAKEGGDVLTLTPMIPRPGSPYNLKLKMIEGERLCNEGGKKDTATLVGGEHKGTNGDPTAYDILKQHPGNIYASGKKEWDTVKAFGTKTGRRNVIHLYKMLRPGQTRGVPYLAPVTEMIKQLADFTDNEVEAAVLSAAYTVFHKSKYNDGATSLDALDPEKAAGISSVPTDQIKIGGGMVIGIGSEDEISFFDPKRPNTAFDPFVQAILRQIGVALEIPFEILIKHFTSSYTAYRGALLDAWKYFMKERAWFASHYCRPIYEIWMDEAVAKRRINAPGYFDNPAIKKAYLGTIWTGPPPGQVDPLKEGLASKLLCDEDFSTRVQETMKINGGDFEKNLAQRIKEEKMRKEGGLTVEKIVNSAPDNSDDNNDNDNDDDTKDKKKTKALMLIDMKGNVYSHTLGGGLQAVSN
jgi:lambda family phage portal protein